MSSVIIPVKTIDGRTTSLSLDSDLFDLLSADFKTVADAKAWVREQAACRSYLKLTESLRFIALHRIAKPSLSRRVLDREAQMDIEEI